MKEEANQLYRRPQVTGQAREEEELSLAIKLLHHDISLAQVWRTWRMKT